MSPRCPHGHYPDECAECLGVDPNVNPEVEEDDSGLVTHESDADQPSTKDEGETDFATIHGFWNDGNHYQIVVGKDAVEVHHLTVGGVRLPLEVWRQMVAAVEALDG